MRIALVLRSATQLTAGCVDIRTKLAAHRSADAVFLQHRGKARDRTLHQILTEERGIVGPAKSQFQWVIDPLDGTTNFLHGFPQYAVSIALKRDGEVVLAVVADPVKDETFTAVRGQGAFLNGRRIRVTRRTMMKDALIGVGFPFRRNDDVETYMATFGQLAKNCAGLRRAGAASLDLAYVAAGRLDAFWEPNLQSWDIAAGSLLVLEAGGLVTDFDGEGNYLQTGEIVAGTPKVFGQLLPVVRRNYKPAA